MEDQFVSALAFARSKSAASIISCETFRSAAPNINIDSPHSHQTLATDTTVIGYLYRSSALGTPSRKGNTPPVVVAACHMKATVTGGTIVFIAGQVALDRSGSVVGRDDIRAQMQQVFENLAAAITAAGGTFRDVIKLNTYVLDLAHLAVFREVRDRYINLESPPASTAIQVPGLFRPELLVEIEAIAVVGR